MFSEITRMRPACARRPDAAIAIDLMKSMGYLHDFCLRMILSENRCPPRIKSGASFFGIMLCPSMILSENRCPLFGIMLDRLPAHRHLEQAETAGVELGRSLVVRLVRRDLDHLVLERDRVAGRPHLELSVRAGG